MKITLLLADDHRVLRSSLRAALDQEPDFTVVAEADNGRQAVELTTRHRPRVVVMDLRMPELNGTEATRRIAAGNPETRVVVLSMVVGKPYVMDALAAGASGFLPKNCELDELKEAIRQVAAGRSYLSPAITSEVLEGLKQTWQPRPVDLLTTREREVVQLAAEGHSSREIAARLNISESTVETHRRNLMGKLGLHSLSQLIKFALREGLTSLDT